MIETQLMMEAQTLYNCLNDMHKASTYQTKRRPDVFLVVMARTRYERRMRSFIRAINEKRKSAEAES